ncbi:MAG: hypothetical protein PHS04_09025 [Tissierellia bacterium]|nr:hypothetical protein [Tissierellia bacterium]
MKPFNPYNREHNLHWSVLQLSTLLGNAIEKNSSTYISYAALEGRMIIERVEFEILVMAAHESLNTDWQDLIEKQNGIQKVNSKYKALKFRYQSFTEAFSKVILIDLPLKPFEFKKAEDFQSRLSQYIHIYTRKPEELLFEGEFIQSGIKFIKETISYLENMFTIQDGNYVFGVLNFSTLKNGFEFEFNNWLKTVDEDVEALTERLHKIASNFKP